MGSIADKLNYTASAKEGIRSAIVDKGVDCPGTAPLGDYDDYIEQISGGGGTSTAKLVVIATAASEVTSDTSLTMTIDAEADDVILAAIAVRSALTLPSNFELLFTSPQGVGGANQTLSYAMTKVTTSGTQSVTIRQATANRIYCNLVALRNVSDIKYVSKYYAISVEDVPSLQAGAAKGYNKNVIWTATSAVWSSGRFTVDNPWYTYVGLDGSNAARLGTFVDFVDNDRSTIAPTFTPGVTDCAATIIAAVEVIGNDFPTGEISITENGTYDVAEYASARVNVESGGVYFDEYVRYKGVLDEAPNKDFRVTIADALDITAD